METNILLGSSKERGARNETNKLPIEIETTFKPVIVKDLKSTVDLYEVYRQEYANCRKFRITLTIKPYCTNVLHNVCTEIVKDEGSDKYYAVSDSEPAHPIEENSVYGKNNRLYRNYMLSNTEYSSPEIGYEYLPGYDIFDNHTLRTLSFRPIMKVSGFPETRDVRPYFNTIRDYMRTEDGVTIEFTPRFSKESVENNTSLKMHVYEHDNLLPFIDGSSSNANLLVENGWYGFVNASSLASENLNRDDDGRVIGGNHIFSHTLNNVGNCEFIDMFPGRDRYSFIPKYNKYQQRYEKNWDIYLTYPWKNYYNHNLVKNVKLVNSQEDGDGNTLALATMRVLWTKLSTNRRAMLFRTFCKHGVSVNDKVAVYLSKNNGKTYDRLNRTYTVDYVGDINGNNADYFFGVSTKTILNDIFSGMVEDVFYEITSNYNTSQYTASGVITEVPTEVNDYIICVYDYRQISEPTQVFDERTTFDSKPKTINNASPSQIRIWDNTYSYMVWDYDNELYIIPDINPVADYGDWNTFTDIPNGFVFENIRVKQYNFYQKEYKNYILKNEIRNGDTTIEETINNLFSSTWDIRFVRVVNNIDCKYYIRQFRKLPNLKYSEEPLPEGITLNQEGYEGFLERNAVDDEGNAIEFDNEIYKLAFSKTLYGDDVAQVTFLDNIVIDNITDNLGRPITDIYATIVKRNSGYKFWYENMGNQTQNQEEIPNIEYSRCFGSLTSGLEYLDLDEPYDRDGAVRRFKGLMSSVASIYRDNNEDGGLIPLSLEDWDEDNSNKEIAETDNVFFGDVVEYNPLQCLETILSDVCFRFNTAQREVGNDTTDFDFTHTELLYDDFDPTDSGRQVPFKALSYKQWLQGNDNDLDSVVDTEHNVSVRRKEGYFYKPHTRIGLRKYGEKVFQGSHRTLNVKQCRPIQSEAIFIKITTSTMHGVGELNTVYLCYNGNWYQTSVLSAIDNYTFTILPMSKDDSERNGVPYLDWVMICDMVSRGEMKIRVKNEAIPSYASKISENLFMWREIVNPVELPNNDKYKHPFSSDAYYVDSTANIYLRRQDPFGVNGLFNGDIGEIDGKIKPEVNNQYKTESEIKCY